MQMELDALEQMNVYIVVPRSVTRNKPILDSTWAFKRNEKIKSKAMCTRRPTRRRDKLFSDLLTCSAMEYRTHLIDYGSNSEFNEQTS